MRATITSKGQITIPEALRRRFGLRPGTILDFDENAPQLTARRVVSRQRMALAVGALERELAGKSSTEWMGDLRGEAEVPEE